MLEIYLKGDGETIRFPVTPSEVICETSASINTESVNDLGEVSLFSGVGLKSIPIDSFFPNKDYSFCTYNNIEKPYELVRKLELALKNTNIKNVIIAGGVSANKYLRQEINSLCKKYNATLDLPEFIYCTDNAAMIGAAAYPLYVKGEFTDLDLNAESHINIC